jgi:hypothetical protein
MTLTLAAPLEVAFSNLDFDTSIYVVSEIGLFSEALRRLRTCVLETDFAEKFTAEHGEGRTVLANIKLHGEGNRVRQEFFSKYQDSCVLGEGSSKDNLLTRGPGWIRFVTEDRIGFGEHVERMLESLAGLPLHVTKENSWRWDSKNRRSNGCSTYIPTYGLFLTKSTYAKGAQVAFDPAMLISKFQQSHCMSRDARADTQLMDYCVDNGVGINFGYSPTRTGFCASVGTKDDADRLMRESFEDCTFVMDRIGKANENLGWKVTVEFPMG